MQEMLNTKKFGDIAFRDKDFKSAIEYYSKVDALFSSPFLYLRWYLSAHTYNSNNVCAEIQILAESSFCPIVWQSANYLDGIEST